MGFINIPAGLVAGAFTFAFRSHFRVHGDSMAPAMNHGDLLHVVPRVCIRGRFPRGSVVVARPPRPARDFWVKRIIALPGEFVAIAPDGSVSIDDAPLPEPWLEGSPVATAAPSTWACDADEYFLMGDNRSQSVDSARFGPVQLRNIVGRVWLRWPAGSCVPSLPGRPR